MWTIEYFAMAATLAIMCECECIRVHTPYVWLRHPACLIVGLAWPLVAVLSVAYMAGYKYGQIEKRARMIALRMWEF